METVNTPVTTTNWLCTYRCDAVVFPIGEQPLIDALVAAGIAMPRRVGMDAALVLSGDSGRSDVDGAPETERPTWAVETLADLVP